MTDPDFLHDETLAIHAGTHHGSDSASIVPPMEPSTNFEHDENGRQPDDYTYTRDRNPNRDQLEEVLTHLEKGKACAAFGSGIAAVNAVLNSLPRGSHVVLPDDVYHGTRHLLHSFGERWGIEWTETDTTDLKKLEDAITTQTRLIWLETPSNPQMKITDLAKATELSHRHGALVCADNTFSTPYNTNPISFGADLVMHSTSKYLGGHSDILGGAIISREGSGIFDSIRQIQKSQGAVPSPRDCWLLTRSIRSFPYRMRAHNENGMVIARFLKQHPMVDKVYYAGLEDHPGHDIAAQQMRGFTGMIAIMYKGDERSTLKAVASSRIIRRATSLGGIESLWEQRKSSEGEASRTPGNLIRLSVGLEHPEDLMKDLDQALHAGS